MSGSDEARGTKIPAAAQAETGNMFFDRFANGRLRTTVELLRGEVGNDPELIKQAIAELFALDRQSVHDHFEGRLEYARHVIARRDATNRATVEFGLQTLKWSFLLNAGAIVVVMAFVGAAVGRSPGSFGAYLPIIRVLWPFAAGCVFVTLAGAAGYFNFCYSEVTLPSIESLNQFLAPTSKNWPVAGFQKQEESPADFHKRFGWKIGATRYFAIGFGLASAAFFALGVFLVRQAVLA